MAFEHTPRRSRLYFVRCHSISRCARLRSSRSFVILGARCTQFVCPLRRDGERIARSEFENRNRCSVHARVCDTFSTNTAGEYQQMNTCLSPVNDSVDEELRVRRCCCNTQREVRVDWAYHSDVIDRFAHSTREENSAASYPFALASPRLVVHCDG